MSKRETEKYQDDKVAIDDSEVKAHVEKCLNFRWNFPEESSWRDTLRSESQYESTNHNGQIILNEYDHTPGMENAVSDLAKQTSAWVEIKTKFKNILANHSELLEETADIKEKKEELEAKKENLKSDLIKEWKSTKVAFKDTFTEAAKAEKEYDIYYEKNGNRHAKIVNMWIYIPALALIGLVEWLINWEAANALFAQPYLAFGIVVLIALAVAAASHEHGTLAKQWTFRCGYAADRDTKMKNYVALGFTTVLFTAAMILVGYMRYKLAYADIIGDLPMGGPFGSRGSIGEVYTAVSITLMGNLIVWILGAMIAYWVHDNDPHFAESRVRHLKASKKYQAWSNKLEKELRDRTQKVGMEIEQCLNTLNNRLKKGKILVDFCDQVHEHETMLLGRLKENIDESLKLYRRNLLALAKRESPELIFVTTLGNDLKAAQYESIALEVPNEYLVKRMEFGPFIERRASKSKANSEEA